MNSTDDVEILSGRLFVDQADYMVLVEVAVWQANHPGATVAEAAEALHMAESRVRGLGNAPGSRGIIATVLCLGALRAAGAREVTPALAEQIIGLSTAVSQRYWAEATRLTEAVDTEAYPWQWRKSADALTRQMQADPRRIADYQHEHPAPTMRGAALDLGVSFAEIETYWKAAVSALP